MKSDSGGVSLSRARGRALVGCLIGVCGFLLVVGVESGTFLRHVVQIVPMGTVLVFLVRQHQWSVPAASGLFGCWLFFMGLIWLYLAGIDTTFTGNFTSIEIVLTVLIGVACAVGIIAATRIKLKMGRTRRWMTMAIFIVLQLAIMWLSLYGHGIARAIGINSA